MEGVTIARELKADYQEILTPEALALVSKLHRTFNRRRKELLARRQERQKAFSAGRFPNFLEETREVREGDWRVAAIPEAL